MTPEFLIWLRTTSGMSRPQFAEKIGVSEVYIQKIETGERRITESFTAKLSASLVTDQHALDALKGIYQATRALLTTNNGKGVSST